MLRIKEFFNNNKYLWLILLGLVLLGSAFIFRVYLLNNHFVFLILIIVGIGCGLYAWKNQIEALFIFAVYLGIILSPLVFLFFTQNDHSGFTKIAILLIFIILGILLVNLFSYQKKHKVRFWYFPIFMVITGVSFVFLFSGHRLLDYFFYIGVAAGIALLGSGLYWRLFGLVIPGSLLIGSSAGVFFAWEFTTQESALVKTGIMLVWMALGWGLVTVFSRVRTLKFLWWPLIPGGIFAMVGWGLYIGGNPESAIGFIGNTGSIGLLIFGIYILLLRRGIHR